MTLTRDTPSPTTMPPPLADSSNCAPPRARDPAIDLTKGALVVLMFVYHSVNYFCPDKNPLRYLHFLPASFIFITGFLLITVQHPKLARGATGVRLHVAVRGLKLLAIFIGLNVAAHTLFTWNYNNPNFGLDALVLSTPNILVVGGQGAAVFDVLLPISYLLILSGLVLNPSGITQRWILIVLATATAFTCVALNTKGAPIYNLEMLSMGIVGMLAGLAPLRQITALAHWLLPLLAANAVYAGFAAIQYPGYVVNIVGVCLALLALFAIGRKANSMTFAYRWLALLGQYSLVGYIAQIAVLQVLYRLARHIPVVPASFGMALVVTAVTTTGIVLMIDRARRRFRAAEATYRVVFA